MDLSLYFFPFNSFITSAKGELADDTSLWVSTWNTYKGVEDRRYSNKTVQSYVRLTFRFFVWYWGLHDKGRGGGGGGKGAIEGSTGVIISVPSFLFTNAVLIKMMYSCSILRMLLWSFRTFVRLSTPFFSKHSKSVFWKTVKVLNYLNLSIFKKAKDTEAYHSFVLLWYFFVFALSKLLISKIPAS